MFRPISRTDKSMSKVNTQISLLQERHVSSHYSSQIGCVSSVKTLVASVGVTRVCSPYSAQLGC